MSKYASTPKYQFKRSVPTTTPVAVASKTTASTPPSDDTIKEWAIANAAALGMPCLPVGWTKAALPVYSLREILETDFSRSLAFDPKNEWREPAHFVVDYLPDEDEWIFSPREIKGYPAHNEFRYVIGSLLSAKWDSDRRGWLFPAVSYNVKLVMDRLKREADQIARWGGEYHTNPRSEYYLKYKYCTNIEFTPMAKAYVEMKQALEERWTSLQTLPSNTFSIIDQRPDIPLLPHQINGAEFMLSHNCLLGDEMGMMKTRQLLLVGRRLFDQKDIGRMVVISPASIKEVWRAQSTQYLKNRVIPIVIQGTFDERIKLFSSLSPMPRKDEETGETFVPMPLYIVGYETAWRHPKELKMLMGDACLVLDEAQKIKSMDSKVTQMILSLNPVRKFAATGTPIVNTPKDMYSIFQFIYPGLLGRSYGQYMDKFYETQGRFAGEYKNLSELNARIKPFSIRRLKKDHLNLPEKLWVRDYETLDMGPQQKKAYKDMAEKYLAEIESLDEEGNYMVYASNVMTKITRLLQICDGYLHQGVHSGPPQWFSDGSKLPALLEILEENLSNGRKAVIWSRFVPPLLMLERELGAYNPALLYGDIPIEARGAGPYSPVSTPVGKFHNVKDCKVFLGEIHTGGQGIDLTCADLCIFYDQWWSPGIVEQAEDRQHRPGQRNNVTYIPMVTNGTIEQYYFGYEFIFNGDTQKGIMYRKKDWKNAAVDGKNQIVPTKAEFKAWLERAING